jgi:histidine triad (HIT) family protein
MASIFTRIIQGEIPCYKIGETESSFAFLDVFPLRKGHVLVVPKKEVDNLFDLDEETYQDLMLFAQSVGKAVQKAIPCKRAGMAVIGLEVPHAHVHILPLNDVEDINFAQEKMKFSEEEMKRVAEDIQKALSAITS